MSQRLDLVLASDLAGDQLRVVHDLDRGRAELACELEAELDRPVLGDVVGGVPDVGAPLEQRLALRGRGDRRDRGRAGVAARPPVHVDDDLLDRHGGALLAV